MHVSLLPLVPRGVAFRNRKFRILKDRHLFDTENVAAADLSKDYFRSIGTKKKSEAIFTGDFSLVKEANLFLVIQAQVLVRDRNLTTAEWNSFFNKGSFRWDVIVPETVTVDEDRLSAIAPGPEKFRTVDASAAAVNEAYPEGRRYEHRRTYLVGANKIVPGGRAIEVSLKWEETGGNGLTTTTSVSLIFAGGEYEPGVAA